VFVRIRFHFGVLRSEQTRLRGFGGTPGAVCLVPFAGQTVSVKSAFGKQGECAGDKTKLVLRDWQAVSVASHGGFAFQAAFMSAGK
jgi:hypothetical protein